MIWYRIVLLFGLLGVGFIVPRTEAASLHNTGEEYTLYYGATVESNVFDEEYINSTIMFTVEPIDRGDQHLSWYELHVQHITHSISSYQGPVTYPSDVLEQRVYFSSTPNGLIHHFQYNKHDEAELVHIKKYMASALSGHFEDHTEEEWDYVQEELDHAGKSEQHYEGKKTTTGKTYHRQKRFNPSYPHVHRKEYKFNHDGILTNVMSQENIVLFKDHFGDSESKGTEDSKEEPKNIENRIHVKLLKQKPLKIIKTLSEEESNNLINGNLELNLEVDEPAFSLEEGKGIIENGFNCIKNHNTVSSKRSECVMKMRNAIHGLSSADLLVIGDIYLKDQCTGSHEHSGHCQQQRDVMIDLIARVDSPVSQSIILKHVLPANREQEIRRSLFHFSALEQPTKESVEAVAEKCFGKNMKNHGVLHMHGNQKRACMTLGAMLKHHAKVDELRTNELLDHLHTWLHTDRHIEGAIDSKILRDPRNKGENEARLQYVHAKSVLLHALGNAAHPHSREFIASYAAPNTGHGDIRHTAMQALRQYTCEESATLLLNVSINDDDKTVKTVAHSTYMQHPKAGKLSHTDENILLSKDRGTEKHFRNKRSKVCDLIEELTLDYRVEFPGFDWSKKVGNEFIGADFGVKMINYAHMHLSPVNMFFELNLDNRAWINAHVKIFKRRNFEIFNAQACFQRAYRVYNISSMVDHNVVDILRKFEAFDEFYSDVVEPIVDSVNEFYYLLENWQDHVEDIDLGLGLRDVRDKVLEVKGNITDRVDDAKEEVIDWVNETFGGVVEFVEDVREFKADVINKKNEINDTIQQKKEVFLGVIQETYEDVLLAIEDSLNEFLQSIGVSVELEFIDDCIASLEFLDIIRDPEKAGDEIVDCVRDKVKGLVDLDKGLMGQINKLLRTVRQMQERFQNITNKIEKVKGMVENIQAGGWKVVVKKLLERHQGLIDEMSASMLEFVNSILDDMGMNLQYIVKAIDEASQFIEKAARLIKDSPQGSMTDIQRGTMKMKISQALFDRLNIQFMERGSELQGKISSWMEAGVEHSNLVKGLKNIIQLLRTGESVMDKLDQIKNAGSPREKLQMALKEISSIEAVAPLLEDIVEDLQNIRYLADGYRDAFTRVNNGMKEAGKSFESLKRGAENAKALVQEIFGIKFHSAFPKQVKTDCDDDCGGCGIYPNIMRGRRGAQMLAESGSAIVAPVDSRVVAIEGSPDEVMLYPMGPDMNDYEIVMTFIKPVQQVYDEPNGYFADAGVVIGETLPSPCQPNFIHVAVRKLNSTVEGKSNSTFGLERTHPLLKARYEDSNEEEEVCGSNDLGEYVPVGDYTNTPDPNANFLEGCSKAEFKHIYNFFDMEALAEKLEDFDLDFEQIAEDIGDEIEKGLEQLPEYPDDIDWEEVDDMTDNIAEECEGFVYDLQSKVTQPLKNIEYAFDDLGNWRRKISFNLPTEIPKMSDFFDTMNFTVDGFGDFLLEAGLQSQFDTLMQYAGDMAGELEENMCEMLDKIKPPKLRLEVLKDGGHISGSKDYIKAQLETLKIKGCNNILAALSKGEEHFCEVDENSGCNILECITKNKFDDTIFEIPVGIAFDPCDVRIHLAIGLKTIEIEYNEGDLVTTAIVSIASVNDINITAIITVGFNVISHQVEIDVVLQACHTKLPACFGYSPVFNKLTFAFGDDLRSEQCTKLNKMDIQFPCQGGAAPYKREKLVSTSFMTTVKGWKMDDFLYSMDRFNISRKDINIMMETARTSVSTKLSTLTSLKTSIQEKEIFTLPDLRANDAMELGPWDIPFYKIPFKFPPFSITVSAGGVIKVGLRFGIKIFSANCSILPQPSVGAFAEADGKASVVVAQVGLKLRGTLLETIFNFLVDVRWSEYPINVDHTLRVDLIPLGVDFKGYFEVLFVPVEFIIFTWKADLIEGNPSKTREFIHDETAPVYEWEHNTALVEQVLGRHFSDPAFYIEAPFSDAQSLLYVEYCIGTYQDGTDVRNWEEMEGPSMILPIKLDMTGVPLYFTVKATNTDSKSTVVRGVLDTYDVTPATGRFEAAHPYTSHPHILGGSLMVIEDSPLIEEQYSGVGVGHGYYGDQLINWFLFDLDKDPINKEGEGELSHFAAARTGKLTSTPIRSTKTQYDHQCAALCIEIGDGCASFDYDYNTDACDLHWTIEGKAAELVLKGAYHNFETLGAGYTAYFNYDELNLIHAEAYYLNARITNVRGYESYLTSQEIIVDFTTPEPGPIGAYLKDVMRHDNCSAAITHNERCIHVTPLYNHRHIIDGPGAATVFNGNFPKYDMLYTISNHYMTANWDGFHDDESDIWGYTWSSGTEVCVDDIQEWDDPHSHLADKSYWTHQGLSSDLALADGPYYVTVQALNSVVFGGALVTSVCHSTHIIVDTTAPWLDFVEDVFYDEDFDLMGVYYKASDPESGIMRTDIGLGETKHDVFVRGYSRHDPLHEGYEMVSVDGIDLPVGIPVWVRVRVVNNVEMLTADHGAQPLMMDPTPPVIGSVLDGDEPLFDMKYQSYDERMCVQWYDWFDPESGIDRFLWGIGSYPNGTDIMEFVEYDHYTRSACVDIQLNHSSTYYNVIKAYNKAINSRQSNVSSDGITVDITPPVAGWVHDGKIRTEDISYSSHAASLYTNWGDYTDPESDIVHYTVTVAVNEVDRAVYTVSGDDEYLEDHTLHLQHADVVQVTVDSENGATLHNESKSTGYVIDLTPPDVVYLKDHPENLRYQTSDSQMYAHWQFEDEESDVLEYRMRIIEHKGKNSFHMWPADTKYAIYTPSSPEDTEFEETINDIHLQNGIKYSVEVTAVNKAELGSKQDSMGVIVDTTPPVLSKVYIGSFGADEDLNDDNEIIQEDHYGIQASWIGYDHESGIIKFLIAVGTFEGDTSVTGGYRDFGTESDGYIDGLSLNVTAETGVLYYVSIFAINGAGEQSDVVSSKPIHVYGENVPGVVYDGRDVYVDQDYNTDTLTLGFSFQGFDSPACGIRSYEWALGTQPGYSDVLPFSSYGIVMMNESHAISEIHIPLHHADMLYVSVRAHTGHRCSEAVLYSCSDGILIDTEPPEITFVTLGIFGNDTEDELMSTPSLYQVEYNSIGLEWNTTDDISGTLNDTWMAGSLPLVDDKHSATITTVTQIPIRAVSMVGGETTIFSVIATDMAGNVKETISPPLTVDVTQPVVEGFKCTEYLSPVQTEVACIWTLTLDAESPIIEQRLAIGQRQLEDQILEFRRVPYGQYNWKRSLDDVIDRIANSSRVFITLEVVNKAGIVMSVFSRLKIDTTPPVVADTYITTPVQPGEEKQAKICQQSTTTMEVTWNDFSDIQSDIQYYEVGLGLGPGQADVHPFTNVGNVTSIFLNELTLAPGTEVYASVRAVNHARLVSSTTHASVHISPQPTVEVWDGLGDKDLDFQNDLSAISGQVFLTEYCPIQISNWTAYDITGVTVVNQTKFFHERFANDELRLQNFRTYYVVVEMVDAINRTLRGKSDGVMMVIQPPRPGEVRDGPYYGEDRNYQESTSILSVNWDEFGDEDDPLQTIVRYEVAIGDNTAYPETRTNVHYFQDVGLNLNHTFYNLRLTPKRVQYFATVKGYSESGAAVQSVSNGIWVGYSAGMEYGEVHTPEYLNNATSITFYWDRFRSDFTVLHYRWAIAKTPFADDNVTLPCHELLDSVRKWATVQSLVDEGRDTYAENYDLNLVHAEDYYLVLVAEDEASQCISAPAEKFKVDLTPPNTGIIKVEGVSKTVQYTTSPYMLQVNWNRYKDTESGITDFFLQLMQEANCTGSIIDEWVPVNEEIDVKDTTKHTYMGQDILPNTPYRIMMIVTNGAGLTTEDWSDPIFLDTTPAVEGIVKDGIDWKQSKYYQSSTTELDAIFAVSPLGVELDCPLIESLLPLDNITWNMLSDYMVKDEENKHYKGIYVEYQERNVHFKEDDKITEILFHYNISTLHLEGGALISENLEMVEGEYTIRLQGSQGEKTIFSITLSDGWMDEYTDFELPIVEDQLTDKEFFEVAKSAELDFDRGLDGTAGTTEESLIPTTEMPATELPKNLTDPNYIYRDEFDSSALGLHILAFPSGNKTHVWTALFWARDVEGVKTNWIYLDEDPALSMSTYKFDIEQDMTEATALWNVYFSINGKVMSKMNGINLPLNYTIQMRHWTHDNYVPDEIDPFNPFHTQAVLEEFTIPLPKTRPCQFGKAFYDMESGVKQIWIGVSNSTSKEDNIAPFHLVKKLCHSCELPCDYYKCSETCTPVLDDGYEMVDIHLTNLTLDPGNYETEDEIFTDFENDYSQEVLNETAYISKRYYILMKTINEAGLESISSSPGVKIDITPPVLDSIEATDPDYDPVIPTAFQMSNRLLAAWWLFEDNESPIWEYYVAVGTSPNSTDIMDYQSVGAATTVTIQTDKLLQVFQTYYLTVQAINAAGLCTFASTAGVTIYDNAPDVSNSTSDPLFSISWPAVNGSDTPSYKVYLTERQDVIGLIYSGDLEENVYKLEWGAGETADDTFITSRVEIDRREYDWGTLEVREDGYFWFSGIQSDTHLTWLAQRSAQINMTMDDEYIDPGHLWLEPGLCVHHQLYAQNMAHIRTLISHTPVCIKRNTDHIVLTRNMYQLDYEAGLIKVSISGKGLQGALISTVIDKSLYEMTYETSANISYVPYIVNPFETMSHTSRFMANRLESFTDRAITISPASKMILVEPVQITMSYTGLIWNPYNESLAIMFWDKAIQKWFNVEESSGIKNEFNPVTEDITGWFAGPLEEEKVNNLKRSVDNVLITTPHMFSLFIVKDSHQNSPPILINRIIKTDASTVLVQQLIYFDDDGDLVEFAMGIDAENKTYGPSHGIANITEDGILTYEPDAYYYGWDELTIIMIETTVPDGVAPYVVEETVRINVREVPFAPWIFLELTMGLNKTRNRWRLFTDVVEVQYEANTTIKALGTMYVCDLNPSDDLDLLIQNTDDENVTVSKTLLTSEEYIYNDYILSNLHCIEKNLKVYSVELNTSADYYGYDHVAFIGKDNFTMYSQPIQVNVYTLFSPCGPYGACTGENDPHCESNDRLESFDGYTCNCDNWHKATWCDVLDVLKITFICVGTCWLSIIVAVSLVKTRQNYMALNRIVPLEEEQELDDLGNFEEEERDNDDSEENDDGSDQDAELETEAVQPMTFDPNYVAQRRYTHEYKNEAMKNWIEPEKALPNVSVSDLPPIPETKEKSKKKKIKRKKTKRTTKVGPV